MKFVLVKHKFCLVVFELIDLKNVNNEKVLSLILQKFVKFI